MTTHPELVGSYRIVRELGRGGMGVVYLAEDTRLGRAVAIKALPVRLAGKRDQLEALIAEARVLASLNHPGIGAIYGIEEQAGNWYLILELVVGETLTARLRRGRMPWRETAVLGAQIAMAAEAAHARDIVHRDLKPDNVMITSEGGRVKVLDFGVAAQAHVETTSGPAAAAADDTVAALPGNAPRQELGAAIGTPRYMSPEQAGGRALDTRTDLWSLGCVLFECLAGRPAFDGQSQLEILVNVAENDPPWSAIPEKTPPALVDLLRRCLAKEPVDRPADMAEVRRELREVVELGATTATERVPGNLPAELTKLFGREQILPRLVEALGASRLLTLVGAGGCGKTRLALRLAEMVQSGCPGGVWLVELATLTDGALVAQQLAATLGIELPPGRPVVEVLVEYVRSRTLLLVLDTCEHLLGPCADLVHQLLAAGSGLRILATSREALNAAGESVVQVPTLDTPDPDRAWSMQELMDYPSVQLFVERATAARAGLGLDDENAAAIAQICSHLDGIPLALELAAARVRLLSVEQIAARLDDRFRLLTAGSRTALPRQQTLRALIDWSYDHLTGEEQRLLRSLAVFNGGWSFDAVVAVASTPDEDEFALLDQLSHLIDKSLVIAEELPAEVRYGQLETIRQYGLAVLRETGEEAALRRRHLAHCLEIARAGRERLQGADAALWLDRFEREHDNFREALEWAQRQEGDDGVAATALELATALARFWHIRGYLHEGGDRLAGALGGAPRAPAPMRAAALNAQAGVQHLLGDYRSAQRLYEEAIELQRDTGGRGEAVALAGLYGNLGIVSRRLGDLPRAQAVFEEALELSRAHGLSRNIPGLLSNLAVVIGQRGDLRHAGRLLDEALQLIRNEEENDYWLSTILMSASEHHFMTGNLDRARALVEEGKACFEKLGRKDGVVTSMGWLGRLALAEGDIEKARSLLEATVESAREIASDSTRVEAMSALARLALQCGECEEARAQIEEAIEILRGMHDANGEAHGRVALALVLAEQGDLDAADEQLHRSLEATLETGHLLHQLAALDAAAQVAWLRHDLERATRLRATTSTAREQAGIPRAGVNAAGPTEETLRQNLPPDRFAAAWSQGQHQWGQSLHKSL